MMDAAFWTEAIKQVPALTVVGVVGAMLVRWCLSSIKEHAENTQQATRHFLAYITSRDSRLEKEEVARQLTERQRDESLKTMGDSCHAFQQRLADKVMAAMDRNTEALGRNTVVLEQVDDVLEDIDGKLRLKPT